jgi:hypothetical protein
MGGRAGDKTWKFVFIGLGFCACAYLAVGCLVQTMAGPEGPLPLTFIVFRTFAALCTFCCVFSLFRIAPAVIVAWIVAISYVVFSWRYNAPWVFHDDVSHFAFWTPLFLSIAAIPVGTKATPGQGH